MRARRPIVMSTVLLAVLVGASCSSSDGRSLPPPDRDATTTSVSAPVVAQPSDAGTGELVLTSPAFAPDQPIPTRHTCTGENTSPPLAWVSVPPAAELAIVVRDRSAGGFIHWVVTGIDPIVTGLGAGGVPEGAVEATNAAGTVGWFGPCPPDGTGVHVYDFVLHVLPEPLALEPGLPAGEAAGLVEGFSSASATLSGTVAAAP